MATAGDETRVLLIGAYGLIGAHIARDLVAHGFQVTGLGRNRAHALRVLPDLKWQFRDLRHMAGKSDWTDLIGGFDVIVNAAGVIGTSPKDNVKAVQEISISALAAAAAELDKDLVQISAAGVHETSTTSFFRTKAVADTAVREVPRHWIFRPGLVIAPNAYGGTALLRMLAATPYLQPIALPGSRIQTVSVTAVAQAVRHAIDGTFPPGIECDLVEDHPNGLPDVVALHRHWLGFSSGQPVTLPDWVLNAAAYLADALAHLGWRVPFRSTAITVLRDGVTGDPAPYRALTGVPLTSLPDTLTQFPASVEHRLAARLSLLFPFIIGGLAAFWILSGLIGLVRLPLAASVLTDRGWGAGIAGFSVIAWALVDISLGTMIMIRKHAQKAAMGMFAVSACYLAATTLFAPDLWADPLGPIVKIIPALLLSVVAVILLAER